MIRHSDNASESWKKLPWKQFRRNLFRLQKRVYKAVQVGDIRKAKSIQKLILKSTAARLLAIRQVSQLNAGKKTAGVDGEKDLTFEERFELSEELLRQGFKVQSNGKFRCIPSADNFRAFRKKVKAIVNSPNHGAKAKAEKLAPLVRGWRNYHRHCKMDGSRLSLFYIQQRAYRVFNKEPKLSRYDSKRLLDKAFPAVPYSENKHINVKGEKSPYDGDITYWSERNSKLYDGETSKALKRQNHTCAFCGLKLLSDERVHLHHVDGNHANWKKQNLMAIHESCHDYMHMGKRESIEHREPCAVKVARTDRAVR